MRPMIRTLLLASAALSWHTVPNNSMVYFCKDDPTCLQPLAKITGNDPRDWNIARGLGALYMIAGGLRNVADGRCTGASLTDGNDNVLLGDYAATPAPNTSGFVNIEGKYCFWRTTGERVPCPPPEPECMPNEPGGK
jgi:hypothetical protein